MPQPFLALITPLSGGNYPDNTLPQPQPPQPPLGIWGPTDPRPGYGLPGSQPRPDNSLPGNQPYPDHGLPGSQPRPDNSLPGNQPYPDNSLPGQQPRPDQGLPPFPSHPIYIPPAGGQPPLGIWGPTDPRPGYGLPGEQPKPTHPIVLPPDLPPETGDTGPIDWKVIWTPITGWAIIGVPSGPVPTPSK